MFLKSPQLLPNPRGWGSPSTPAPGPTSLPRSLPSSTATRTREWPSKRSPPAAASPPPSPSGRSGSIQSQALLWARRRLPGSPPAAAAAPHASLLPPCRPTLDPEDTVDLPRDWTNCFFLPCRGIRAREDGGGGRGEEIKVGFTVFPP